MFVKPLGAQIARIAIGCSLIGPVFTDRCTNVLISVVTKENSLIILAYGQDVGLVLLPDTFNIMLKISGF